MKASTKPCSQEDDGCCEDPYKNARISHQYSIDSTFGLSLYNVVMHEFGCTCLHVSDIAFPDPSSTLVWVVVETEPTAAFPCVLVFAVLSRSYCGLDTLCSSSFILPSSTLGRLSKIVSPKYIRYLLGDFLIFAHVPCPLCSDGFIIRKV